MQVPFMQRTQHGKAMSSEVTFEKEMEKKPLVAQIYLLIYGNVSGMKKFLRVSNNYFRRAFVL
jgi:hypothetical protein